MKCYWHLCDKELTGRRTKFCSISCKNKGAVTAKRQKNKADLVAHHGGQCLDCGYKGPPFMFDFDHREPVEKSFGIAQKGKTPKYETLLEESLKCDLVCANCHRMRTHIQRCPGCDYCSN